MCMKRGAKMTQTVYIDILVITNIYIGYILLSLAGLICSSKASTARLFLSAVLQGVYSLVILLPQIPLCIRLPARLLFCALFVFAAYGYRGRRSFVRLCLAFFAVSAVFAGLMSALWILVAPGGMACNNGAVYFQIDALTLAVLTAVCYAVVRLIYLVLKRQSPTQYIYTMQVEAFGRYFTCNAFLDTGNGLHDVFTGLPVIVVDRDTVAKLFDGVLPFDVETVESAAALPRGFRLLPCSTASGGGLMAVFRPENVVLRCTTGEAQTENVLIGIAPHRIKNGDYEALLSVDAVDGATKRRVGINA